MKIILSLIFVLLVSSTHNFSQHAGDLDSTFGVNGIVVTEFEEYEKYWNPLGLFDGIKSIIINADGKILCTGTADKGRHFIAVRYKEDGSIDETYGQEGKVILENLGQVVDAKKTGNGKLIVAGFDDSNFVLIRLKSDGLVDSSFGVHGIVKTIVSESTYFKILHGLEVLPNDNILIVGSYIYNPELLIKKLIVIRYLENGEMDFSFGEFGVYYYPDLLVSPNIIYSMPIDNLYDNRYIISMSNSSIMFKDNGIIDSTFGTNGVVNFSYSIPGSPVQGFFVSSRFSTDNDIILGGFISGMYLRSDIKLSRLNIENGVDSSFGTNGTHLVTGIDDKDNVISSIVIQDDNKIITSGYRFYSEGTVWKTCFESIRFHENGVIDSTFGDNGIVRTHISDSSQAFCSVLQNDEKLLVAGVSKSGDFTLVRYHTKSEPTSIFPNENPYSEMVIYPNPVHDVLYLDKVEEPILLVEIRDVLCREMPFSIQGKSIDVTSIPSGNYYIKILTEKGESFSKFIKM